MKINQMVFKKKVIVKKVIVTISQNSTEIYQDKCNKCCGCSLTLICLIFNSVSLVVRSVFSGVDWITQLQ